MSGQISSRSSASCWTCGGRAGNRGQERGGRESTLARIALPEFACLDLEDAGDLARLAADIPFVLEQHPRLVIDQPQRLPELFPTLRSFLDRHPRHKVVLLGPASPALLGRISESLTGRIGFLDLAGFAAS